MFKWISKILNPSSDGGKTEPQKETKTEAAKPITLEHANEVTDFPLRVFVIVGKQGYGKTTLAKSISEYYRQNGIETINVKELADLDQEGKVLLIDDLKEDVTDKVMTKIVEDFRAVRHKKQIIILTHQILDGIPSDLLKLSEKIILFNTNFNVDQPNAKINMLISKSKKHQLHELVLSLPPYQYIIVKENKIFGAYPNTDINPIVGDTQGKEISLINGNGNNGANTKNTTTFFNCHELVKDIPEWAILGTNQKIRLIAQKYPHLKPRQIAIICNTTPNTVRVTLCRSRK